MTRSKFFFDQAATSYPKHPSVMEAMVDFMTNVGANCSRGAYKESEIANELLFSTRMKLTSIIGNDNPMRTIFTTSATSGLNQAIQGVLRQGDHVITSSLEHNSTIRVLKALENSGVIELTIVKVDPRFDFEILNFEREIKSNTRAIVVNHGCNVFGTVIPIEEITELCREYHLISIVDGSQTVGSIPVNIKNMGIDILCFACHKALGGPMGTGAMIINDKFDVEKIRPTIFGGTGSFSREIDQPKFIPDAYESGTMNLPGIAGLSAALDHLKIDARKEQAVQYFAREIKELSNIITYIDPSLLKTGVISFNHISMSPSDLGSILGDKFGIQNRVGLHCSPLSHRTLGTFPHGTVRFSFASDVKKLDLDRVIGILSGLK